MTRALCDNLFRILSGAGPSSASCPAGPGLHHLRGSADSALPSSLPRAPSSAAPWAFGLLVPAWVLGLLGRGVLLGPIPARPAHALFPLPVPGASQHVPSAKAFRVRSRVASRRVAHVAVMACNFLFAGSSCQLHVLTHPPNRAQSAATGYVLKLCRACGAVEPFCCLR